MIGQIRKPYYTVLYSSLNSKVCLNEIFPLLFEATDIGNIILTLISQSVL